MEIQLLKAHKVQKTEKCSGNLFVSIDTMEKKGFHFFPQKNNDTYFLKETYILDVK